MSDSDTGRVPPGAALDLDGWLFDVLDEAATLIDHGAVAPSETMKCVYRDAILAAIDHLRAALDARPPNDILKDAAEIRSSYGFLLMRLAVAKDAQDTYDVCKREFTEHEAAFQRLGIALGQEVDARPPQAPQEPK